jgi:hypothetical protein
MAGVSVGTSRQQVSSVNASGNLLGYHYSTEARELSIGLYVCVCEGNSYSVIWLVGYYNAGRSVL